MTEWMLNMPPEFERPFKQSRDAVRNWRPDILRYFEHPYTSAYIERLNGLIRKMNVQGAGYEFETLRAKALLKHGRVEREVEGHKLTRALSRDGRGSSVRKIYGPGGTSASRYQPWRPIWMRVRCSLRTTPNDEEPIFQRRFNPPRRLGVGGRVDQTSVA